MDLGPCKQFTSVFAARRRSLGVRLLTVPQLRGSAQVRSSSHLRIHVPDPWQNKPATRALTETYGHYPSCSLYVRADRQTRRNDLLSSSSRFADLQVWAIRS